MKWAYSYGDSGHVGHLLRSWALQMLTETGGMQDTYRDRRHE